MNQHHREWEDMSKAQYPFLVETGKRAGLPKFRVLKLQLREVGYIFWDARDKKRSEPEPKSKEPTLNAST